MLPRPKRVKTASTNNTSSDNSNIKATLHSEVTNDDKASSHDSGLLHLPIELFDMILEELWQSCGDCGDVTREVILMNHECLRASYTTKEDALRSLSQVCRTLRLHFLPLCWEHVQACVVRKEGGAIHMILGERLLRLSRGLPQSQSIASLVRTLTVSISKYQAATVFPAWADCLESLPSLRTVQIMWASAQITTPLKKAFVNRRFPQIRTVILPDCAHNFLRACPEVIEVICNDGWNQGKLATAIAAACKKVEIVQDITPKPYILDRLVEGAPRLRDYRLSCCCFRLPKPYDWRIEPTLLRGLSALNDLSAISITVAAKGVDENNSMHFAIQDYVDSAKIALHGSKFKGPKQVHVQHALFDSAAGPRGWGLKKIIHTEILDV
ncbi:hypothetical protein QCA50_009660 [Cerrena zonata]|uniref:F-box domain-containing protein n=1 Tax=Cerrena zonata TaxID=2478898 RepID=A0AAW0G460_9APHY